MSQSEITINALLDASGVEKGAEQVEKRLEAIEGAASAKQISMQRALATGFSVFGEVSRGIGAVTAAGGHEQTGKIISEAAGGMQRLGTMLAPLGPMAMSLGAAVGGVSAAVSAATANMIEKAEKLKKAIQSGRDFEAATAISRRDFEALDEEDKNKVRRDIAKMFENIDIKMARGATLSDDEITRAAQFDPRKAREMMSYEVLNGRSVKRFGSLYDALTMDEMDAWKKDWEKLRDSGGLGGIFNRKRGEYWAFMDRYNAAKSLSETLGDPIDLSIHETPELPEEETSSGNLSTPKLRAMRTASADALSAAGIGYTGNPMRESESLLREIRDGINRGNRLKTPAVVA